MIPSNNSAACSVCFGSGFDVAGKPCPFAPHRDAATLKAAQGGVTDQTLREMCRAYETTAHGFADFTPNERGLQAMRAALEAALSAEPAAQGEADLAGYVDPEQVADMQRNGGGVSIGSFSERYGRTVPVYFRPAPPAQPADSKVIGADSKVKPERVPEEITPEEVVARSMGGCQWGLSGAITFARGWNACRDAMLTATPAAPAEEGDGKEVSRG